MPTNFIFRGDAPPRAQITRITPIGPIKVGDVFAVWCNGKAAAYVALTTSIADVVAGLADAISASTISEFAEMLASASDDGTYVSLVAVTAGIPFEVRATSSANIAATETTAGGGAVNEVHKVQLIGTYTAGNFKITYDVGGGPVQTANIAYNASAATVQAALAALSGVGTGNVSVTGGAGPSNPWFVTFNGTLGGMSIAPGTIDGTGLTGNGSVTIAEVTKGNGLSNDIQVINTPGFGPGTPDTYTLTLDGQTTAAISVLATAAQIKSAIEALPNVGSGNTAVYQGTAAGVANQGGIVVFVGALAGTNVSLMTVGNYTGDPVNAPYLLVRTLQEGGQTSADDFQFIDHKGSTILTFTYKGKSTTVHLGSPGEINGLAPVVPALEALSTIGTGNVRIRDVLASDDTSGACGFALELIGSLANTQGGLFTVTGNSGVPTVTRIAVGAANSNEVQSVTVNGASGTFTLTLGAQTTSAIAYNAVAATVKTRIEADLSTTITACTVTGSGTAASPYLVTVTTPAKTDIAAMTGNGAGLGGGGLITELTAGHAGTNEVQTLTEVAGVSGGTFVLGFGGQFTGNIAWNASAAVIQAALRALSTINTVTIAGSAGGPYTVTWSGAQAGVNQPLLSVDGSLLTGMSTAPITTVTTTFSGGPNHFNEPLNWVGGRVPDSGGSLYFEFGETDCLYGLAQMSTFTANATTDRITFTGVHCDLIADQIVQVSNAGGALPAGLAAATNYYLVNIDRNAGTAQLSTASGGTAVNITDAGTGTHSVGVRLDYFETGARYTGLIGLPKVNETGGYYEYRSQYLHIGLRAAAAKKVTIGTGDGNGSQRIKLDTDVDQVAGKLITSGGRLESGIPAILWKGTHANNTWEIVNGDFGASIFDGELSTLAGITERAGAVELGGGCTLTGPIDKTGGTLRLDGSTVSGACLVA